MMVHICMGGNLIFLVERYDLMKYGGKNAFSRPVPYLDLEQCERNDFLFRLGSLFPPLKMQLSPKKMLSKSLILD